MWHLAGFYSSVIRMMYGPTNIKSVFVCFI